MIRGRVLMKFHRLRVAQERFVPRKPCCISLAWGNNVDLVALETPGSIVVCQIALLNHRHGYSNRSLSYIKVARLNGTKNGRTREKIYASSLTLNPNPSLLATNTS